MPVALPQLMLKLFTDLKNIPRSIHSDLLLFSNDLKLVNEAEEADYVLFPHWEAIYEYSDEQYLEKDILPANRQILRDATERLIIQAQYHKKKSIVFHFSDEILQLPFNNTLVFKTNIYNSTKQKNEFPLPAWKGDLLNTKSNGNIDIRKKSDKPKVGFRGSAKTLFGESVYSVRSALNFLNEILQNLNINVAKRYQWNQGQIVRKECLDQLAKNKNIDTRFKVLIRGYLNQHNLTLKENNYFKFINNILTSDYTLCVRGNGNYSYRFYETISAGRIPLFVNTDCVLPFEDIIDWRKICVWVEEDEIDRIDQVLLDFHNDLSNDDFEELQFKIRSVWDTWIKPEAYFSFFEKNIKRKK